MQAGLGAALVEAERTGDAITVLERALSEHGPHDGQPILVLRNALALAYLDQGRPAEALPLLEDTLVQTVREYGDDHPQTSTIRNNLALAYWAPDRVQEAAPLLEAVLAAEEASLGPDHPSTLVSRNNLALAYWRRRSATAGHSVAGVEPAPAR